MSTKLIIKQSQNTAEQVVPSLIDKLYQLASTEGALTNDSDLEGTVSTGTTYEDAVTFLQTRFPNLTILASAYYIRFVDSNVLQTLLNANIGDGVGVSTTNAALANIRTIFEGNSTITDFDEFKYFTVANTTGTSFHGCTNLESIDLSYCTKLDSNYFENCEKLCYFHGRNSERGVLTVAEGTSVIGRRCFGVCKFLTNVIIPASVTSIGEYAFTNCYGLTSVIIPDGVMSIGDGAFFYCTSLTSLAIPSSVTSIGNAAFNSCSSLTSITVKEGNNVFDSRGGCNAIIETSSDTLIVGCQNTIIPNSVTSIGGGAFSGCSGLTSITIPNSVTSIGNGAFLVCHGLTAINIPSSVTSIGDYAFRNCSGLTSITITATAPPTLGNSDAFSYTNNCPIYVPAGSVSAYQTTGNWTTYASRIQAIPT